MGVCDSSTPSINSISTEDDYSPNKSLNRINTLKNNNLFLKDIQGYILPENLAKRDNVKKYYKITKKSIRRGSKWYSLYRRKK